MWGDEFFTVIITIYTGTSLNILALRNQGLQEFTKLMSA